MHFVKWIRKNERKIMAWVVILIMISFVGGYGLQQFLMYLGQGGSKRVIATYDDGRKIRAIAFQQAQNELEILHSTNGPSLMADRMLSVLSQVNGDLSPELLQLILFPDTRTSGELRLQLIQMSERGQLPLKLDQINQFFAPHRYQPEILWILLKTEAAEAGCVVTQGEAANFLRQVIAGMTQNKLDANQLVSQISLRTKKTDEQIIGTFASLMSVMNYADLVLGNYSVTSEEIRASVARNMERLKAEVLQISADSFIDQQAEPDSQQLERQFQQFKASVPGLFTQDNRYAFGYKIPKTLQVEYFLVNVNDIKKKIPTPTSEDLENYYSRHLSDYQKSEPIDPNNPDAGSRNVNLPFAQVITRIRQDIERQKTEDQASAILNEARQMTETGFDTVEMDTATVDQLQQAAGDYVTTANELSRKYGVSIYTGKTGWLRPSDVRGDPFLQRVYIPTATGSSVPLMDLLYAIPQDGKPSSQPGLPSVRIWENISPLSGGLMNADNTYVPLRAMVRVTGIREPLVPESVDYTFENNGVSLTPPIEKKIFSVKEQVVRDIKTVQAMDEARKQADELAALVKKDGWDKGLKQFDKTYYPDADPNNPLTAGPRLRTLPAQPVASQTQIDSMLQRLTNSSAMVGMTLNRYLNALLVREMYETMDPDQQTTGETATVLPFPQGREICVIKELTKEPATLKDYQDNKNRVALQLAKLSKIDLGLIFFNPENIVKRMHFEYTEPTQQPKIADDEKQDEEV